MGRKVSAETPLAMIHERALFASFYLESERKHKSIGGPYEPSEGQGRGDACEFRDFCSQLYYIDGKCRCMTAWKRSAGLVLPVSV